MPVSAKSEMTYWDNRVTEVRRGQLTAIRNAAGKWRALLTALLGAFSAVAFAGGLTSLDELPSPWAAIARSATTAAALASILSIILLSDVSGGLRIRWQLPPLTAAQLAAEESEPSRRLLLELDIARGLAVASAALVLVGSLVVLWAPTKPPTSPSIIAVFKTEAVCGSPVQEARGALSIAGRPLAEATDFHLVTQCPPAPDQAPASTGQ